MEIRQRAYGFPKKAKKFITIVTIGGKQVELVSKTETDPHAFAAHLMKRKAQREARLTPSALRARIIADLNMRR